MPSIGRLGREVIGRRKTYRRPMESPSQRCNGCVTTKSLLRRGAFPDRAAVGHDALQAGLAPGPEFLGERRVPELRSLGLAVVFSPPHELDERPALGGIVVCLVNEQPREARDGVGLRAG